MHHAIRYPVRRMFALLLCAGALAAVRCSDPQQPSANTPAGLDARWSGAALEFALDGGTASGSRLALVASNLQFDAVTEVLRADVAVLNRGAQAQPGPAHVVVYGFIPSTVQLLDAACGAPLAMGECAVDYRGAYGEDGMLGPGESSAPVAWRWQVPGGESFAFRTRLGEPEPRSGTIAGTVFRDIDGDGVRDAGEPGLGGVSVELHGAAAFLVQHTNDHGEYGFHVDAPGIYAVNLQLDGGWRSTTALPLQVTVLQLPGGALSNFTQGDIGLARGTPGPSITVEGHTYADLNRDGHRDPAEPGIAGVKIRGRACGVASAAAPVIAGGDDDDDEDEFEVRTDALGHYVLALPDCGGPWEIRGGSVGQSDRTTPKSIVLLLRPEPGTAAQADFGYAPEDASTDFEVRGVVFRDDNGDGVRGLTEPALAGIEVTADGLNCASPVFAADRTDERGRYELEGQDIACPLPWVVRRADVPGMEATTPAAVQLDAAPVLGQQFVVNFGVRPLP